MIVFMFAFSVLVVCTIVYMADGSIYGVFYLDYLYSQSVFTLISLILVNSHKSTN